MTGKWFLQEIEHLIKKRNRLVILDTQGLCGFLLPLLEQENYKVLKTDNANTENWEQVKEELLLRHQAETAYRDCPVVFYVTREQKKLSFLFDYCHTHGCLDLSNPAEWLRKKLFEKTGLQVQLDNSLLLSAAKVGIDKDLVWWKNVIQKLIDIIDVETALLEFLHEPEKYMANLDADVRRLIEERFSEVLGQPHIPKHPTVLANELVKRLFEGLVNNDVQPLFLKLYYKWADSDHFRPSLENYRAKYKPDPGTNPWAAHPDHCFETLDRAALKKLTSNLWDKTWVKEKLEKIKVRACSKKVPRFVPAWWGDVVTLLEFDTYTLASCNTLQKVIDFYTWKFHHADRAIRNLYVAFLPEEEIMRPLQEYYESLNSELLQQWFAYFGNFQSNQHGWLVNLFKTAGPRTAVIVCDGLRYEIAEQIAASLEKKLKIERNVLLAAIPTETETGMSALFSETDIILKDNPERQKKLKEATGKEITWMKLEELSYGKNSDYLGLLYGDIDYASEKLQMAATKLFDTFRQVLVEKIDFLINTGYKEVHLVTDHGFVLTGLLTEADKIEPHATGKKDVHERFIRTVEKQYNTDWLGFEKPYGEYKYVCAAKNHRPFRTTGSYGYSHGGITPQEIIIPRFLFKKAAALSPGLEVMIGNSKELEEVTGDIFAIHLRAGKSSGDLFASVRKVKINIYSEGVSLLSSSPVITMGPDKTETAEFSFSGKTQLKAILLDADTQEQLDSVMINKSTVRDMGGLI